MLPGGSLDEHLEAVAAVDPAALARSVEVALRAGHAAGPWRPVAADPARWLRTYVTALRRAWTAFEPLWTRSAGLLDREVERVSVALAHGAGVELIAERFAPCSLDGDDLLLPSHTATGGRLRIGGSLQLQPLLAPPPAGGWTDDYARRLPRDPLLGTERLARLRRRAAVARVAGGAARSTTGEHPHPPRGRRGDGRGAGRAAARRPEHGQPSRARARARGARDPRARWPPRARPPHRARHRAGGALRLEQRPQVAQAALGLVDRPALDAEARARGRAARGCAARAPSRPSRRRTRSRPACR